MILPLFLFSGTFFPVSRLPLPLEWVAYATPLWHGVDLCRSLTLGTVQPLSALGHVAYLALLATAGPGPAREIALAERPPDGDGTLGCV